MHKALFLFSIALFFAGCASKPVLSRFYQPVPFPEEQVKTLAYSGQTSVIPAYSTEGWKKTNQEICDRDHTIIGQSTYVSSQPLSPEELQKFGKKIGADIIVLGMVRGGSETQVRTMMNYSMGPTTNTYGKIGGANFSATTQQSGTWSTQQVPVTVKTTQFSAVFWRKIEPRGKKVDLELLR